MPITSALQNLQFVPEIPEPPPVPASPTTQIRPTRQYYTAPEPEPLFEDEILPEPEPKKTPWLLIGGLVAGYFWLKSRKKRR